MTWAMEGREVAVEDSDYFGWILAGVSTVIATLSGIVTQFYKRQISDYDRREVGLTNRISALEGDYKASREEIKDCHKQREEIRVELAAVKTRLEIVEQRLPCAKTTQIQHPS
jgi:chromosome segregation ATPase